MIRFEASSAFDIAYRKMVSQNPSFRHLIYQKIQWFCKNPNDTRLANHALHKRLSGKWAFSITDDIRIIYSFRGKNTVRFLAIGTHREVYIKSV